jgi:hypothetical protein
VKKRRGRPLGAKDKQPRKRRQKLDIQADAAGIRPMSVALKLLLALLALLKVLNRSKTK